VQNSWMVGDSTTDIQTARNAGLRSILLQTGICGQDGLYPGPPDVVAQNLVEAMHITFGRKQEAGY